MGKLFELMGLAALNIFVALALSATFLADKTLETYESLSESNVQQFVKKVTRITTGSKPDIDSYEVTSFFMDHISEDGRFMTNLQYDIPDMDMPPEYIEMGKMDFISNILKGKQSIQQHESEVDIEHISVDDTGERAKVITSSYERGVMPITDFSGQKRLMPVLGMSYCEQTIILNDTRQIQMAGATCSTNIKVKEDF